MTQLFPNESAVYKNFMTLCWLLCFVLLVLAMAICQDFVHGTMLCYVQKIYKFFLICYDFRPKIKYSCRLHKKTKHLFL